MIIVCGLPRSGTTYIYQRIAGALPASFVLPEEVRLVSDPASLENWLDFAEGFYDRSLTDPGANGGRYSGWGSKERFVSLATQLLPAFLTMLCHRGYIERETIPEAYTSQMNSFLSNSLQSLKKSVTVCKRPLGEKSWPILSARLPPASCFYIICLRDPFKVYASLTHLGWVASYQAFLDLALASYNSSIDIIGSGDGMVIEAESSDAVYTAVQHAVEKRFAIKTNPLPPAASIDSYWVNSRPRGAVGIEEEQFTASFKLTEAGKAYEKLAALMPKDMPAG